MQNGISLQRERENKLGRVEEAKCTGGSLSFFEVKVYHF